MTRNKELFLKIADAIEKHPESYDQSWWGCGTKMCVAGHACAQAGYIIPLVATNEQWEDVYDPKNRCDVSADDAAMEALGLTDDECQILFATDWLIGAKPSEVAAELRAIAEGKEIE